MRKTRPEDFDPNYRPLKTAGPKPEKVNMDGIVPIKPRPATTDSNNNSSQNKSKTSSNRTTERPNDRTAERERITKRHAFEIYRDQYDRLKKIKAEAMLNGNNTSMSEMVREAIDAYLEKHNND